MSDTTFKEQFQLARQNIQLLTKTVLNSEQKERFDLLKNRFKKLKVEAHIDENLRKLQKLNKKLTKFNNKLSWPST